MTSTESLSPRYAGLESWPPGDFVDALIEGQFAAIGAVAAARESITRAIEAMAIRLRAGGRIIYLGAGTSGRIAALDASELLPTFNWPQERAVVLLAGGTGALLKSKEGAEDDTGEAVRGLTELATAAADVVIGIAASGRTPFVQAGLACARKAGALTIGIVNNAGSLVGAAAEIEIVLPTGAEMLAGSTRMKAGTAQKVAINALSTGAMVRLGYVYRGLMVEMRPSNAKLQARAEAIVAKLTGAEPYAAARALAEADGSIKLAVVMLSCSLPRAAAERALDAAGGSLRAALEGRRQA